MRGNDLQLPLDGAGFSTRTCPRCRADFKVRWSHRDARVLAAALTERVEHLNRAEIAPDGAVRHCPYCAAVAAAEAWWTPEQQAWLDAEARSLAREVHWRRLQGAAAPGDLTMAVDPDGASMDGEDPDDDLVGVPLPCCGEELRVSSGWGGPVRCHFCGFVHARAAVRDAWKELAQLRDWIESG